MFSGRCSLLSFPALSWSLSIRLWVLSLSFCRFGNFRTLFFVFLCCCVGFPVLFGFCGSSLFACGSLCVVLCFSPVHVISAPYILHVCSTSAVSFSIGALVVCDAMRMPFAPFCPYLPLLLLFVSASVVSLLCFYSGLLSLFPAVLLRCSFLRLVSRRFELSPSFGVHLFLLLPWGGLFIGLHLLSLVSSSLFSCVGFWFLRFFCLVQISGSLRNMVSLWDESRFAVSSLLLSSLASFRISFP